MRPTTPDRDKLEPGDGPIEPGYEAWKRAKVERGLAQSQDRATMISIEQIWRDLKLER